MPCVLVDYEVARRISCYAGSTGSPASAADTRLRGALVEGRRCNIPCWHLEYSNSKNREFQKLFMNYLNLKVLLDFT
jgi:hypothetical protein